MKNSVSYKTLLIVLVMFYTNHIIAQSNKSNIPSNIIAALTAKCPGAQVKNWDLSNNEYTAKIKEGSHKYFVAFDQNGNWIKTTTKLNWPWKLPLVVKTSLKKCKYKNWNIYGIRLIDKPSGQFYQVMVNDQNHPADIFHQNLITESRVIEFRSDGGFVKE